MVTPSLQFYPPSKARMDFLDSLCWIQGQPQGTKELIAVSLT